jgi:surface protein
METKQRFITMFIALVAMFMGTTVMAKETYAVLSDDGKTLTFRYDSNRNGSNTYDVNSSFPTWTSSSRTVETVVFEESFEDARLTSTWFWFEGMNNLSSIIGLEYLNTSEVTNMTFMFASCYKLSEINLSGFNTSKVTNMSNMFLSCSSLKTLDLSSFNTKSVTDMQSMFGWCLELETIIVGENWSTEHVTSSDYMFSGCTSIIGGAGTIFDENHLDKGYAHIDGRPSNPGYLSATLPEAYAVLSDDGKTLTFRYDSSKSSYGGKAYNLNEGDNAPGWLEKKTIETVVFDVTFKNVRPTTTCKWFYNLTSLGSLEGLDNLNTSDVTNMNNMFYDCRSLISLDLRSFNTSNVVDMKYMFAFCDRLKSLDISSFNTSKVEDMQWMFNGCAALTSLDLRSFNTSNVQDMRYMFNSCANLTTITVSTGWNTNNVRLSFNMFSTCNSLVGGAGTTYNSGKVDKEYAHIDGGESAPGYLTAAPPEAYAVYDPQAKTLTFCYDSNKSIYGENGYYLNEGATAPGWIDFSNPKVIQKVVFTSSFQNVQPLSTFDWFYNQPSLTEIVDIKYLNTSSVENMSGMFYNCSSLTELDVSGFDTQNVTTMSLMFDRCSGLTNLYLVNFDTRNVSKMHCMFEDCTNLTTITVGVNWNTTNVESSDNMFYGCTNIVGGTGTRYDENHLDKEYAIVDGLNGKPGYLTAVSYGITVSGKAVTFVNKYDVLGNETVNYDDDLNILTLIGADVSSINIASTAPNNLLIKVNGECKVKNELGNAFTSDIANVTIEGPGKLTIGSTRRIGIKLGHNAGLIVDNVDLIVSGSTGIEGSYIGVTYNCHLGFFNANCTVTSKVTSSPSVNDIFSLKLKDCIMTSGKFDRQKHMVIGNPMIIQRSGGISTDINSLDNGELGIDKSLPLYNLNGQRVSHPVKGQIYIQNGRKIKF